MKTATIVIYRTSGDYRKKTTDKAGFRYMRRLAARGERAKLWTSRGPFDGYRTPAIKQADAWDNSIIIGGNK